MVRTWDVMLVVVGRHWVSLTDEAGRRRLESPTDFVRIEVEAALARDIPVIPVLVQNATMQQERELPQPLAALAYRNGIEVRSDAHFHADIDLLIRRLDALLAAPPVREPSSPIPRVGAQYQPGGPYLLVVDDSSSVRRVVSNMLKANGWEVVTSRDGVEALERIARERPAAVLLDIEMPRMDGYELMASIRAQEQYQDLPLIVLTSLVASRHRQRAMQLGANAYLVKPYQDQELFSVINRLVQTHER